MNSLMFPVSPTNGDTKEDKVDIVVESVERFVPFWIVPDAEIALRGPIVLIIDVFSTYIDGCSCDSETYYPVCELKTLLLFASILSLRGCGCFLDIRLI